MSNIAIELKTVTRQYNGKHGVCDVSFQLHTGDLLSIFGPSGSGKSTILRLIAGLDRLDKGEISIASHPVSTPTFTVPPHQRRCAMIFQDLALWPHMTVTKHLHFVLSQLNADERLEITEHLLSQVQLISRKEAYPHQLSGGQQQRLAIARALAAQPKYLLMDEPFSSLDFKLKNEMIDLLSNLKTDCNISVIYVTHDLHEILRLSDSVLSLEQGKVVFFGSKQNFQMKYQHEITAATKW